MKRWPLITSFLLFIALCMSAAYWAMQLFKPPVRAVAAPHQPVQPAPRLEAAVNLLGGRATVAVASNFQLKGVVVSSNPAESVAILAANGRPTKAFRTNAEVMPGVTVKEVQRGYVLLLENGVGKRVELPDKTKMQAQAPTPVPIPTPAPILAPTAAPTTAPTPVPIQTSSQAHAQRTILTPAQARAKEKARRLAGESTEEDW